ncbi:3-beta hydroxysteroid dehydrogenase [Rummeliibacillus sp. TYF005]|uniref:SDR family oxidoreductase n=1 Tax=Rummeliibacillus sp. TYF005 TaxID=2058214 RepID=UPI000F52E8E2|nr:SDR family oxidoreductase [Rummeliibacillus sp. TYF005]RPJ96255.1 3-beta hydroxysteroid dehydrogenase [Rummeliibacillus sp. TYF005]
MTTAFFTGFPGFIASRIIREAFENYNYDRVYTIVLATQLEKAQQEKKSILSKFPDKEIVIIEGDITLPQLDLSDETIIMLQEQVEVVWHLAAIYDLAVPRPIAWKVNVHGTEMMNLFVESLPKLKRYVYFSTAYVAGTREGNLLETELIRPNNFKNFYEETKFEAELLVDQLKSNLPVTIIRPGIVWGNSKTGETIKFDGPYFIVNMIDRLKKLPIIPYIGHSTSLINVVPVDYIYRAAVYLSEIEEAEGKTVHLTDPNPHPVQEVYRAFVKEITGKTPRGHIPLSLAQASLSIHAIRKKLGVEYESLDYLTWNANFDTTVANKLLKNSGIECADFIKSIPIMIKYYEENKHNKDFHIEIR